MSTLEPLTCACGCGELRHGRAAYAHDACRTRAWKQRTGYVKPKPENAENGSQERKSRRSGRQHSHAKAVRRVQALLVDGYGEDPTVAELVAEIALSEILPERQR